MAKNGRQGEGGGREPIKLTSSQLKDIEKNASNLKVTQLADYLGIGYTTFVRIMEDQPEVAETYKKAKANKIKDMADGLYQKGVQEGGVNAMFWLKCNAGWREYTEYSMRLKKGMELTGTIAARLKKINDMFNDGTLNAAQKRFLLEDLEKEQKILGTESQAEAFNELMTKQQDAKLTD